MKTLVLFILLGLNRPLFAADFFPVNAVVVQINSSSSVELLQDAFKNPESLLKRFRPTGAQITSKIVSNNEITFNATKTYLLITKTIKVHGVLDANESNVGCASKEIGYDVKFDFYGSDSLVSDNIDKIESKLCLKVISPNQTVLTIKSKILKANNYSNFVGGFVKSIIEAQIPPLVQAITETITKL